MIDLDAIEARHKAASGFAPDVDELIAEVRRLQALCKGKEAALEARIEKVVGPGGELDQAFQEGRARGFAEMVAEVLRLRKIIERAGDATDDVALGCVLAEASCPKTTTSENS